MVQMDPLTVVIIEDEEAHFQLMKQAIDKEFPGTSVHHFGEAGPCLESLDEMSPDIIITDYLMPGMNGIEFLEALDQREKGTPVIMITGQGDEGIAVQAMKLGAADYLVKSADFFAMLPRVIEKVIRERKLKQALERSEARFKEIFAQSPIGIELYDSDGLLLDLNKSCLDMFGISDAADIIGFELFADQNVASKYKARLAKGERVKYEVAFDFEKVKKLKLYETTKSGIMHLDVLITPLDLEHALGGRGYMVQVQDITTRKRAEEHIHMLSQQVIRVLESERHRLSCDLHDNLAQDLSTLKISLDTLFDDQPDTLVEKRQRVSQLSKMVKRTITDVRNLAYDLRPSSLDQLGLVETVFQYCEDFSKRSALKVDFFSVGLDNIRFHADIEIALYRLIQEGLSNIQKHAEASHVTIRLSASFPHVILRIEDNGKGFDLEERLEAAFMEKRMGFRIMEERAALLDGKMKMESRPNQGTKILVEIPYKEKRIG